MDVLEKLRQDLNAAIANPSKSPPMSREKTEFPIGLDVDDIEEEAIAPPDIAFEDNGELNDVYSRYHATVNMTAKQLKQWAATKASGLASLDKSPINRNLELLTTPKDKWTSKHIAWAKRTISFISRMRSVEGGSPVREGIPLSKREISLLNWAYNPTGKSVNAIVKGLDAEWR